ncbi:hypothetical protein SNE40_011096 [Patella caerulea]|uniref:Uncharacterized protein n=1 Tax=Patella caerulea TaxID=87958 RepID=A0AAN8JRL9_PATCE
MWRTVSFVERIEVEFKGNLFNQAMVLGDVDNDQRNELIVGNIDGDLAVFKGSNPVTCRRSSGLGIITCIGVGDICNQGKNNLVCLTAEGTCYLFDIKREGESGLSEEDKVLKAAYKQELPANSKVLLLADIDGQTQLIVGYSDRVIRSFKWQMISSSDGGEPYSTGQIVFVQKWKLAGQTETITINKSSDGRQQVMASQPGGTLVTLLRQTKDGDTHSDLSPNKLDGNTQDQRDTFLLYHPLGLSRAKNRDISTVIVGDINPGKEDLDHQTYYALATLDGTLVLAENDKILWSLQVDHQLFSLSKLDVTGNGQEEVVCCSWDGQTYIVNHSREVVRYLFQENVAAFSGGFYSLTEGGNIPCFVYATFNNTIYIYHDIKLPRVESTNLLQVMDRTPETNQLLAKLNIDPTRTDQLRELYHWCLYGWPTKS